MGRTFAQINADTRAYAIGLMLEHMNEGKPHMAVENFERGHWWCEGGTVAHEHPAGALDEALAPIDTDSVLSIDVELGRGGYVTAVIYEMRDRGDVRVERRPPGGEPT